MIGVIRTLLIANRGEIAVRIIRACRELEISPVAVYSEADAHAQHVRLADAAILIGPSPASESYLRADHLIVAAQAAGADAVHPGYGFLAENADFAAAVRAAGLIFVGPPSAAIRQMGNKIMARTLMQTAGVPIVPGYDLAPGDDPAGAAGSIGYPVLVKAVAGGGGRGMRIVHQAADLIEALRSAQAEAASAFGDATVFLEKYIQRGRHIEFQVFGDSQGQVLHLFERECSIQRRHQKIIEESPSPMLAAHPDLRASMASAAVAAARAVGYTNAGTVEFIVDPDSLQYYFLEMNTRLQVEHAVTELVTGLDLVKLQLRVAAGEPLPFSQAQVVSRGHALECRVYAEDPADNFYPSIGPILESIEPHGPGVRVDSGFDAGDTVSQYYDALLAKVIVYGADRTESIRRMQTALADYVLLGLRTNLTYLRAILAHPVFQAGAGTTQFVAEQLVGWQPPNASPPDLAFVAAAVADYLSAVSGPAPTAGAGPDGSADSGDPYSPWRQTDGFRLGER